MHSKFVKLVLGVGAVGLTVWLSAWVLSMPRKPGTDPQPAATAPRQDTPVADLPPLRLGIIPERDVFAQRQRTRLLADVLEARLHRRITLVTASSYAGILDDFTAGRVDFAFLGSYVAVLVMDRCGGRVLAKPEAPGGASTYHGVIFVREQSPVLSIDDLAGHSVAMIRTTTSGELFPRCRLQDAGLWESGGPRAVRPVWFGTHDDVVAEVLAGRVDAGAVKDTRLNELLANKPSGSRTVRRLATSDAVPENALVVRAGLEWPLVRAISEELLTLDRHDAGRAALAKFGVVRFVPCEPGEYAAIHAMIDRLGGLPELPATDGRDARLSSSRATAATTSAPAASRPASRSGVGQ